METPVLNSLMNHFLISILPGVVGGLLGFALTWVAGRLVRGRVGFPSKTIWWTYWFPWRGIMVSLLVLCLTNIYWPVWFGMGRLSTFAAVAASSTVLATFLFGSGSLASSETHSIQNRFISVFRMVLPSAVGFGVVGDFFGAGGAGTLIRLGMTFHSSEMGWGYGIVTLLAVFMDFSVALLGWAIRIQTASSRPGSNPS